MEREKTCCFTGHRPDKLPWGEAEDDPRCLELKWQLDAALELAYQEGCRHFISGMARGADFYFAEAVLTMRERHSDVTLECARPCETQSHAWSQKDQERYDSILDRCNYETLVQHRYKRGCMMRRNRYMVNRSNRVLAVYDGVPEGGTSKTLDYALKQGLKIDVLWIKDEEDQ